MKIKWYGHSCFMLESENGTKIVTDPCDPSTGYDLPAIETDIVTVSHAHHDHNYTEAVKKYDLLLDTASEVEYKGIRIKGILTYHDDVQGKKRGGNIVYVYDIDGMKVAHAGDIGEIPDSRTLAQIGDVDILLVPVGGVFTIDSKQAREFANMLKPKVVIPMHYKTHKLTFDLADVSEFVNKAENCRIHRLNQDECTLSKETLGEDRIIVFSVK